MKTTTFLALVLMVSSVAHAENWGQFRGPHFNGSTTEKNLPSKWSQTENVAWVADLPGASAATPIIWGDHVFVSTTDAKAKTLKAICLDRKTGKVLWSHEISKGINRDSRSNYSAPTPATDGKHVVFFFGNGELITYDFAGKKIWARNIQKDYGGFHFGWTFSTSPVLFDGKLYLQVLQRDVPVRQEESDGKNHDSFILAMDPATGKELFRHVRPSKAKAESREAFTTPTPVSLNGRKELLVVGGDAISGHDLDSGKELWRWGTWNPGRIGHWRLVPSPVVGEEVVLVCAPKRDPIYAIKTGGSGQLSDKSIAWTSKETRDLTSDVPTPAFAYGDFFILSDVRKSLSRVDPKTGKAKWTMRTPGTFKYEASPLVADGKVYIVSFVGDVIVVNAEDGKIISENWMDKPADDPVRSGIVASQGQLFIRVNEKLFCIGKK
ncbi:MAG: PQQ-binding-like beta-propeller repeat protein [Planctomycetota bacterium]|nr:PQQ-binding-like beta-propeller repeat protein [Planctomycetota bacterium]